MGEEEFRRLPRKAHTVVTSSGPSSVAIPVSAGVLSAPFEDIILMLAASLGKRVEELVGDEYLAQLSQDESPEAKVHLPVVEETRKVYYELPATQRRIINFRDEFPFLREPDCPIILKAMVADMFAAYDRYRESYARLGAGENVGESLQIAQTVVDSYLDNRAMWAELEYYKANGRLLGKHPVFEIEILREEFALLPAMELSKKIVSARSNISRWVKKRGDAKADQEMVEGRIGYYERVLRLAEEALGKK
jgi:hypothetical protein